jgi:transcriptional regulator with GAF, ATPase, and Fis domain
MTVILSSLRARQDAYERELAAEALKVGDGYMARAARLVGIHPSRFREIVRRHNLRSLLNQKRGRPSGGNAAWRALADV